MKPHMFQNNLLIDSLIVSFFISFFWLNVGCTRTNNSTSSPNSNDTIIIDNRKSNKDNNETQVHVHDEKCKPGNFCGVSDHKMYNAPIAGFNLTNEINLKGRNVRIRYWVLGPGGYIREHYHENRPAIVYYLKGQAVETRKQGEVKPNDKGEIRTVKANEVVFEQSGTSHWWVNSSNEMVKLFAVDIVSDKEPSIKRTPGIPRLATNKFLKQGVVPDSIQIETFGFHDLAVQFPNDVDVKDYIMRARRFTILPNQITRVENAKGRPSITYVIQGDVLEHREDEAQTIRRAGECTSFYDGVRYYWENPTSEKVVLFVVDFVKKSQQ